MDVGRQWHLADGVELVEWVALAGADQFDAERVTSCGARAELKHRAAIAGVKHLAGA